MSGNRDRPMICPEPISNRTQREARVALLFATVALAFSAGLVSSATAQGLPATGSGLATDGEGRVAVFAPGGGSVALYSAPRRRQVGVSVAIPSNAEGGLPRLRTIGVWGNRILLAGFDPANTRDGNDDRLALVDVSTGRFLWLCAIYLPVTGPGEQVEDLGACPNENGQFGLPRARRAPRYEAGGSHWLWGRLSKDLGGPGYNGPIRWSLQGNRFTWNWPTAAERRAIRRSTPSFPVGTQGAPYYRRRAVPIAMNSRGIVADRRWGYERLVVDDYRRNASPGVRVVVRRTGDRQRTTLQVPGPPRDNYADASFGNRGACMIRGSRVSLWERRSRRIWTRTVRSIRATGGGPRIVCAGSRILLSQASPLNGPDEAQPISWTLRWPTTKSPRGWRRGEKAMPGKTTSLR